MVSNLEKFANSLVKDLNGFVKAADKELKKAINTASPEDREKILKQMKDDDVIKKFTELRRDINSLRK